MSGLALPAPAGDVPIGAPGRGVALRTAGAVGRAMWRLRVPAAASSAAAAAAGTMMSVWASTTLTRNVIGRPQLPLAVTDLEVDDRAGQLRLSGPLSDVPGRWGLALADGYAVVGSPSEDGTRPVRVVRGRVRVGDRARLDSHLHEADDLPADLRPVVVLVDAPAGGCPAWRFDGPASASGRNAATWAVFVHGRGARLTQALRVVPALRAAGLTTLIPSYRGDEGAPEAPLSGLGCHEWRDIEAAVAYAADHGARRVVLVGYSMGAALITALLRRSEFAPLVAGVVLDSPVLDWGAVLRHVARARRMPSVLVPTTMTVTALRARIDWRLLNALDGEQVHRPPCLLFHGTRDALVPVGLSDALAEAWPEHVTYHRVDGAPHVASYNVDPQRYESALRDFLGQLPSAQPEAPVTTAGSMSGAGMPSSGDSSVSVT